MAADVEQGIIIVGINIHQALRIRKFALDNWILKELCASAVVT